jgi:hypothetical protein
VTFRRPDRRIELVLIIPPAPLNRHRQAGSIRMFKSHTTATADEARPITLGGPRLLQRSVADRETQLALGIPNSGSWDMLTVNESGAAVGGPDPRPVTQPDQGRRQ